MTKLYAKVKLDDLPRFVRAARIGRGWTQVELGERAGVHSVTVARIEGGFRGASYELMGKLLKVLRIEVQLVLPDSANP